MPYIYALRNKTTDLVYYGSTKTTLQKRLKDHRCMKTPITSKQITSCPTAYIELIEEVSVEDRFVRERWWIENNSCVNKHIPTRTPKEYRLAVQEQLKVKKREYYIANQERLKAIMKQNYLDRKINSPRHPPSPSAPSVAQ